MEPKPSPDSEHIQWRPGYACSDVFSFASGYDLIIFVDTCQHTISRIPALHRGMVFISRFGEGFNPVIFDFGGFMADSEDGFHLFRSVPAGYSGHSRATGTKNPAVAGFLYSNARYISGTAI
ncbi:hypothetical protein [Shimwellia pseudoproteus]|uniref:hypothetical protein n=1 Tax=Shimwellia pseudoproteus TaxID=570012 RepID=UPI0018EC5941|nr:hypothetical protein [Shimwellia pseudoproteus]